MLGVCCTHDECSFQYAALQGCMEQHRDYYKDFMLEPDFEDKGAGSEDAAPKEEGSTEEGSCCAGCS